MDALSEDTSSKTFPFLTSVKLTLALYKTSFGRKNLKHLQKIWQTSQSPWLK